MREMNEKPPSAPTTLEKPPAVPNLLVQVMVDPDIPDVESIYVIDVRSRTREIIASVIAPQHQQTTDRLHRIDEVGVCNGHFKEYLLADRNRLIALGFALGRQSVNEPKDTNDQTKVETPDTETGVQSE